ncbi:MAG: malectin domain-containing carbohydrate-binding protein, partial [Bacteroidota bacterium]
NQNTLGQFDFDASATGLASGDTRNNIIVATAQGFQPASLAADLTVTDAQVVDVTTPFRLNVAGAAYDRAGDLYSADDASYLVETQPTTVSTTAYTPYTVPGGHQDLYFPRRFGPEFSYVFPIANGTYNVAIHMVENFQTAANARIFDVSIEGEVKIDDIDLFATYGKGALGIQTFEVTVADGTLDIDFLSSVNNAIVQAIEILPVSLNDETDILTFAFAEETGTASIDDQAHTVSIEVDNGTDLSTLVPTITLSDGAMVSPLSGVANDFSSSPVEYVVTAEDGVTSQEWNVTVTVAAPVNTAPVISSAAAADVAENSLAVINVEASDDNDAEGAGLVFAFNGGVDDALFTIDADTGEISFINAPDFEIPQDDGEDNIYDIKIIVTDSGTLSATQ